MLTMLMALTAQADETPDWTVTVDPLTFAIGYAHVQVERKLSNSTSLYVGPHLRLFDGILADEPEPYIGLGMEAGLRWFPGKQAPKGPWLMTRTVAAHLQTTEGEKVTSFGGYTSFLAGYTGIIKGRLVLSGGAGLNVLYYTVDDYGPSGLYPALHTNIGFAF